MAEKELLGSNLSNLNEDLKSFESKRAESEKNYIDTRKELEEKESELEALKEKVDALASQNYLEERKIKELETEKSNTITQIKVYENRKKLLTDLQNEYEGYSYTVKKLLKESDRNPAIKNKIVGVVASLIKVPEKFETAIEVAKYRYL